MRQLAPRLLAAGLIATGASASADHIPVVNEDLKLLASDGEEQAWFGHAVAIDGDTIGIGAVNGNESDDRPAYVFERTKDGAWAEVARLIYSDGSARRAFGESVSLDDDTFVVGARVDSDRGEDAGAAYVFERSEAGVWMERAKLLASDGESEDRFGVSVTVAGDTIVVGAECRSDLGEDSGAAYVFERDETGLWVEKAKLLASDGEAADAFGADVAIDDGTIVVGARGDDDRGRTAGAVYVFERTKDGVWVETAKLLASDGEPGDIFGAPVAIDGDVVAVGATNDDDQGISSGAAYVFEQTDEGTWVEAAKLRSPHPGEIFDDFGTVAVSGETVVVGASGGRIEAGSDPGTADVFKRTKAGQWINVVRLLASDAGHLDQFGIAVGIDGDTVVAGARLDDDQGEDAGSAYVFSVEGCVLELRLDPPALRPGEKLRVAISLEHNRAETVAVPLRLWVEDAAGEVIVSKTTAPITFHHGDVRRRELTLRIPEGTLPGDYRVLAGIERMQQGLAGAVAPFRVLGPSTRPPAD